MMKKAFLILCTAVLLMTGCTSAEPEAEKVIPVPEAAEVKPLSELQYRYLNTEASPDDIFVFTGALDDSEKLLLTRQEMHYDYEKEQYIYEYSDIFSGIPVFLKAAEQSDTVPGQATATKALPEEFVLLEDCVGFKKFMQYRLPNAEPDYLDYELSSDYLSLFNEYFFQEQLYKLSDDLRLIDSSVCLGSFQIEGEKKTLLVRRFKNTDSEGNTREALYELFSQRLIMDTASGFGSICQPDADENGDYLTELFLAFPDEVPELISNVEELKEYYLQHIPAQQQYFIDESFPEI